MCHAFQINDVALVVPRNSIIEANQSGLIAEPLIDITPQLPIPVYRALPNDPACAAEGSIVCAGGNIEGRQGVALDDLVYIMTRIARNMDDDGFDKIVAAAGAATEAVNVSLSVSVCERKSRVLCLEGRG